MRRRSLHQHASNASRAPARRTSSLPRHVSALDLWRALWFGGCHHICRNGDNDSLSPLPQLSLPSYRAFQIYSLSLSHSVHLLPLARNIAPRQAAPCPSDKLRSPRARTTSDFASSGLDMQVVERAHNSATTLVSDHSTQQNVNEDPWAAEISGKVILSNEPLIDFFKKYVPCHSALNHSRPWTDPTEVFEAVPTGSEHETDKYRHLVSMSAVALYVDH